MKTRYDGKKYPHFQRYVLQSRTETLIFVGISWTNLKSLDLEFGSHYLLWLFPNITFVKIAKNKYIEKPQAINISRTISQKDR